MASKTNINKLLIIFGCATAAIAATFLTNSLDTLIKGEGAGLIIYKIITTGVIGGLLGWLFSLGMKEKNAIIKMLGAVNT